MNCYNCGSPSHISKRCPLPQKYTHCPSCDKVTSTYNGHSDWCTNKNFRSTQVNPTNTIREMTTVFDISFQNVEKSFDVIDANKAVTIGLMPLWLPSFDGFVSRQANDILAFTSSHTDRKSLAIVNKDNIKVISLELLGTVLQVNNRYVFKPSK